MPKKSNSEIASYGTMIQKRRRKLRAANPKLAYTDAIAKASAELKAEGKF